MARIGHKAKRKDWCECGVNEKTSIGNLCAECFKEKDRSILEKIRDAIRDVESRRIVVDRIRLGTNDYYNIIQGMYHPQASQALSVWGVKLVVDQYTHGKIVLETSQGVFEYEA